MRNKSFLVLLISVAGAFLAVTGVAKLISASGSANILVVDDPIFKIPFRQVFYIIGLLEIAIAIVCLSGTPIRLQACLVAWLGTCFLLYRVGLIFVDYHRPCSCMGNLTDALNISPRLADEIAKVVLVYLLFSGYATLFFCWRSKNLNESKV
jgi:hypothetical protein